MMKRISRSFWLGFLVASCVMSFAGGPRAQAAEDAPQAVPVGIVAVKSIDAVNDLAKQIGVPLPPQASAQSLEQQFPFLGAGGLVTDKPIGAVIFGGPAMTPDKAWALIFPVKATAATPDQIKAKGGVPAPGHADTFVMGDSGMALRRTADYLMFGPQTDALAAIKESVIADALKDPDALLRVNMDLKAVRTNMPEQYKAMFDAIRENTPAATNPGEKGGQDMAMSAMRETLDQLDHVEMGVDHGKAGVRIELTAQPVALPPAIAGERAGMPEGVVARFDLATSPTDLFNDAQAKLFALMDTQPQGPDKPTPEEKKQLETLLTQARTMYLGNGAVSLGVEFVGQTPVVYLVSHHSQPMDYAREAGKLVGEVTHLAATAKDIAERDLHPMDLQTYSIGADKVLRLRILDKGQPKGFIDAVQKGDQLLTAISPQPFRFIDRLLAAKSPGPMQGLAAGYLDMGKLFNALAAMPGTPVAGLPDQPKKQLASLLQNQRLTFSASSKVKAATFDMTIPDSLLQNAPKLVQTLGGGE